MIEIQKVTNSICLHGLVEGTDSEVAIEGQIIWNPTQDCDDVFLRVIGSEKVLKSRLMFRRTSQIKVRHIIDECLVLLTQRRFTPPNHGSSSSIQNSVVTPFKITFNATDIPATYHGEQCTVTYNLFLYSGKSVHSQVEVDVFRFPTVQDLKPFQSNMYFCFKHMNCIVKGSRVLFSHPIRSDDSMQPEHLRWISISPCRFSVQFKSSTLSISHADVYVVEECKMVEHTWWLRWLRKPHQSTHTVMQKIHVSFERNATVVFDLSDMSRVTRVSQDTSAHNFLVSHYVKIILFIKNRPNPLHMKVPLLVAFS